MAKEILMAHIDYENIRWCYRDYIEWISINDVIRAFEELGKELGELRQMFFYGDWTRRRDDCREIEAKGYRAVNVLSKSHGGDRSDIKMSLDISDQLGDSTNVDAFIIGAGDADYKEVVFRCRENGKRVYILCFGSAIARELISMTHGVYPLEGRLGLTKKQTKALPSSESLDELGRRHHLIQKIDSLERGLPHVVLNYLKQLLIRDGVCGETYTEINKFFVGECLQDYINEYNIPNPKIPGKEVICIKLKRDSTVVTEALRGINEETKL